MSDVGDTEQPLSDRLARIQENLRGLLEQTTDQALVDGIEAAAHELGLVRLGLDTPSPRSRRAHLRVKEAIGTALLVGDREIDAAIIDISVGGVGLMTEERLPPGTLLRVAVPPIGWIEAEVVAVAADRLHLQFRSDPADAGQQRALLDLVLRHYD